MRQRYVRPCEELLELCTEALMTLCAASYGEEGYGGNPMTNDEEHNYDY